MNDPREPAAYFAMLRSRSLAALGMRSMTAPHIAHRSPLTLL